MAEGQATQFLFTHRQVIEALLRLQGIREGHWQLAITFNMGAGNFATAPDQINPGALVFIYNMGIQRVDARAVASTAPALMVDAATLHDN